MTKETGLNEAWMLHVALQQGKLSGMQKHNAEYYVGAFLGTAGTWESPQGKLSPSEVLAAEVLLFKLNKPKKVFKNFSAIVARFASDKSKVYLPFSTHTSVELSAAPMTGKNPGAVYVRVGHEYAGKIMPNGHFWGSGKWADASLAVEVCLDAYAIGLPKPQNLEVKSPSGFKTLDPTITQIEVLSAAVASMGDAFEGNGGINNQLKQALVAAIVKKMDKGGDW